MMRCAMPRRNSARGDGRKLRACRATAKSALVQLISREEAFNGDRKSYATSLGTTALTGLGYPADLLYLQADGSLQAASTSDSIYAVTVCTAATSPCVNAASTLVW